MWVLGHRRDTFDHARPCAVFVVDGHGDKSRMAMIPSGITRSETEPQKWPRSKTPLRFSTEGDIHGGNTAGVTDAK